MIRTLTVPLALLALALSPLAASAAGVTTNVYSSQEASNDKETGINESCKDVRVVPGDILRARCNELHSYDGGTITPTDTYVSLAGRLQCVFPTWNTVTLALNNPDGHKVSPIDPVDETIRLTSDGRRYVLEADCRLRRALPRQTFTLELWHYLRNGSGNLRWR